ncbi:MAG: 50S ribosomal protein L11 methyltransferase [Thermodesulfobacteriota bacterium]|nr:50S ribosomal protein L11 methyltransferase [Thermodesulfobacteriota bacterium]
MASCKAKSWLEVAVTVPRQVEEALHGDMATLVPWLAWQKERQADDHCLFTAMVVMGTQVHDMIARIEEALRQIEEKHLLLEPLPVELHVFEAEDPAGGWKEQVRPRQISSRLTIGPPCEQTRLAKSHTVLSIDPQDAFGDGNHPSTRLALRLLDELLANTYGPANTSQGWVLDAGCGSGVLALAAAGLGGLRALGVDLDPKAIEAAQKNLRHNPEPGSKVFLALGDLSCARGPFCVVLANLVYPVHMEVCHTLWPALAPGGWLILSGFCQSHKDEILSPYVQKGASERALSTNGAWAGALLHKPASEWPSAHG